MSSRPSDLFFAALRQIRSIRRSLPRHALLTLIRALVVSKIDYCNSVPSGTRGHRIDRLQFVLNAAARLVLTYITTLLRELHWLRVPERIKFGCVYSRIAAHGTAPPCLADSLH